MELQTVTIFRSWVELASDLPSDKERGQFYHAVCTYALSGIEPELSGILKHYFQLIRPVIDKSAKRKLAQEKSVAKRKEASSQTESQNDLQNSLQNNPHTESQTESQTKSQTECVSIRVREKELSEDNSKKKQPITLYPTFTDLIPERMRSEKFIAKWREWEHYRRNRKKAISEAAATKQLKMLSELSEADAIAAIDQSIQNDYQGIFPPKGNMPNNQPQPKKDYSGI